MESLIWCTLTNSWRIWCDCRCWSGLLHYTNSTLKLKWNMHISIPRKVYVMNHNARLGKKLNFQLVHWARQCYFCPGPLLVCLSWRFSYKLNFLPGTLPIIGQRRFKKEIFPHIIFFEHFSLFFYPSLRLFIWDTFLSMILWWLLSYACIL